MSIPAVASQNPHPFDRLRAGSLAKNARRMGHLANRLIPEYSRRPQCGQGLLARATGGEGFRHYRRSHAGDRAGIVAELEKLGSPYRAWVLEDLAPRPLKDLPPEIVDDLETSQVTIFAVRAQRNELRSRMQMTDVVNRQKIRHAHMVNINRQIMLEGMRADFLKVDRLSTKVVAMVRKAKRVRAKTAAGTDLIADLNPNYRWLKTSGIISRRKMGEPAGR